MALIASLAQGGCWGASAGLWAGLRNLTEGNSLPEETAPGCGGKMKVGFAKGLWGESLGLGTGEVGQEEESCSGVGGREEMGVVTVLELVVDVGGVVLRLWSVEGLGCKGG